APQLRVRRRAGRPGLGAIPGRLLSRRARVPRLRCAGGVSLSLGAERSSARTLGYPRDADVPGDSVAGVGLRVPGAHPRVEIKPPVPIIPAPIWRNIKDLQEWEQLHQTRPEGDTHWAPFESLTQGILCFSG